MQDKNIVNIEIVRNQEGKLTLCVSNQNGGVKLSPGKVSGCETVITFTVESEIIINAIKEHSFKGSL
jgi:predicted NUDIX family NTP pyrophosphohydrolase